MYKLFIFLVVGVSLCGCVHQRDLSLVRDRVTKLQPLSKYASTACEVETLPTQPALARYEQMYAKDVEKLHQDAWTFKWRQTEAHCDISARPEVRASPVVKAQQGFVEAALCLLSQYFFINSPFDELPMGPEDVRHTDRGVQIQEKGRPDLGLFIEAKDFLIETRTKARGEFSAHYKLFDSEWLPDRMEHKLENMQILLDQVEYGERVGARRMLKSLMLSVGTERPVAHSQLLVRNCHRL